MGDNSRLETAIAEQLELLQLGKVGEEQVVASILTEFTLGQVLQEGSRVLPMLRILGRNKKVAAEILSDPQFEPLVLRALHAKDERLADVALATLESTRIFRPELLNLIAADATGIADRAAKLLAALLGRGAEGLVLLAQIDDRLKTLLAQPPGHADIVRIRILACLIDAAAAAEAPTLLEELRSRGYVAEMLGTFLTDDMLVKLNGATLLEALGSFAAGAALLRADERIVVALEAELQSPLADSSENAVMLVVANLGLVSGAVFWLKIDAFLSGTGERLLVALRALSIVARHADANVREALKTREAQLQAKLKKTLTAANVEVVKTALDMWTGLVFVWSWETAKAVAEISDQIFDTKPFPDVRAFNWRLSMRLLEVGSFIGESSRLLRLLRDFKSEDEYDPRRAKWLFVCALVASREASATAIVRADKELWGALLQYAQQGVGYAPALATGEALVERVVG